MFYSMAGAKLLIGNTYAWKNTDFVLADFTSDTFVTINEVDTIGGTKAVSAEVAFQPYFPAFKRRAKGARDFGTLEFTYGVDALDVQQIKLDTAEASKADYGFRLLLADAPTIAQSGVVTVTLATPGVFTWTAHLLRNGCQVQLSTTGALYTGLLPSTNYYVVSTTANTFSLALTTGGAPITTSGTQSGVHTLTSIPQASERYWIAKVMGIEEVYDDAETGVFKRKCSLAVNCRPVLVQALP